MGTNGESSLNLNMAAIKKKSEPKRLNMSVSFLTSILTSLLLSEGMGSPSFCAGSPAFAVETISWLKGQKAPYGAFCQVSYALDPRGMKQKNRMGMIIMMSRIMIHQNQLRPSGMLANLLEDVSTV